MDEPSNDEAVSEPDLTDAEVASALIRVSNHYVDCCNVGVSADCCIDCHKAHENGHTNLATMEKLGPIPVETFLCCVFRSHWHGLSNFQKVDLLNELGSSLSDERDIQLNEDLVRDILLAIEAAVHEHDDASQVLMHLQVPGYGRETVSDQIEILDGYFVEAGKVSYANRDYWYPIRMTRKGWQFVDTVGDASVWKLTRRAMVRSAMVAGKRQTNRRLGLLLALSTMYAKQSERSR